MWKTPALLLSARPGAMAAYSTFRRPGETDQALGERIHEMAESYFTDKMSWVDGKVYPFKSDKSLFGRATTHYAQWGELRKQKKPPHTEVLYVWAMSTHSTVVPEPILVLRSINNCTNDQLREAIQLAALRLEQKTITQTDAEFLLDRCYAELQRRMEWTDREKEKRGKPSKDEEAKGVEGSF
jgi:hypothetical protein